MEYLSLPPGQLTTTTAALACGVRPATIRDWVRRGLLRARARTTWRCPRSPLLVCDRPAGC
ncbi:helix-turn-helix domain-containing protein [Streptomyces sp. H27-G5]|uniref:helix-turn-helix domain-containing protein n=1 Tax=Streptomyces sp. H27-G5 TaxID=2996698 RepID=UPI003B6326C8